MTVGRLSHNYRHLVDWVGLFPTYSLCDKKSDSIVVSYGMQSIECDILRERSRKRWLILVREESS
jgi:hypothetical protein